MAEYLTLAEVHPENLILTAKWHTLHDSELSTDISASIVKTGLGLIKLSLRYQPVRSGIIKYY
jgi:hypothetical protein